MINLQHMDEWQELSALQQSIYQQPLSAIHQQNIAQGAHHVLNAANLHFDFNRHYVTPEILTQLVHVAQACQLPGKITALFTGSNINHTENRPAKHYLLRAEHSADPDFELVQAVREKMKLFCLEVNAGKRTGITGKKFTDVVNIGIGGSHLGPQMVVTALSHLQNPKITSHFVSNVDANDLLSVLNKIKPESTLFLISSKTFTTQETLLNADTAKDWLCDALGEKAVQQHFVAITAAEDKAQSYGIDANNIFAFWDFVGGRYSLWSAIGLSIALSIGYDNFSQLLAGAHTMDEHFKQAPLAENMPVIQALLGLYYQQLWSANTQAIVAYNQQLEHLVPYLQQLSMESLGKSITDQQLVQIPTGAIVWGGIGTNGQHAYHQLLHQGTQFSPVEFILPLNSHHEYRDHQDWLVSHCLAQAQALMHGQDCDNLHESVPGNKVSTLIYFDSLSAKTLGALIALYEHSVFCHGMLLGINPFDQYGVELGKSIAKSIHEAIVHPHTAEKLEPAVAAVLRLYTKKC